MNTKQNQAKCKINVEFGEALLFAKTDEETAELTAKQEAHYLECDNPICQENMAYLKKAGLFQVTKEVQDKILTTTNEVVLKYEADEE